MAVGHGGGERWRDRDWWLRVIRLKPCAGHSPIHGLRFAVRLSLIENIFRVREVSICRNIALRLLAVAGKVPLV